MKHTALLILFLMMSVMLSCSSSDYSNKTESILIGELKKKVNDNSRMIESCEAYGNISFDSPEMSNSGFLELKVKMPDSIYIKIEGPFGLDIAAALITPDNFIYYNVQENKVITGSSTEANINAVLKFKLGFKDLVNTFCCSFIFDEEPGDTIEAQRGDNMYFLSKNREIGSQKFYVLPSNYMVNKYNITDNTGLILEVKYSSFSYTNKIQFPSQIKIKKPFEKQTVWVSYESVELNNKNIKFRMRYPGSAKIIKWE